MHPGVALETSTLRRVCLVQHSSCYRASPKLSASLDFHVQSDSMRRISMRRKNLSQENKKTCSSLLLATWIQLFLLLFDFESSSPLWSSWSSWNSWYNKWSCSGWYWTNWRKLFHSSRVKFPLVNMSANWGLVSKLRIWIFGSKLIMSNYQSRATLWSVKHVSLWDVDLW